MASCAVVSRPEGATTVLLFGPQALSFSEESFQRLRTALTANPDNAWMLDVVAELPEWTRRTSEQFPKLKATPAAKLQESLKEWLAADATDSPAASFKTLPNALLTPLVVIDHLAQYGQYVQLAHVETASGLGSDLYGPQPRQISTLGFCTGLLSALAVSSASSQAEFRQYAAVAIRLAALIGAVVDAEEVTGGESKTFSTACHSSEQEHELQNILQEFPEAYISVNYDQNRATLTTSEKTAQKLQDRFRGAGITAHAIGLRGRFHYRNYSQDLEALISICDSTPGLQLPDASAAVLPIHSLSGAGMITEGKLHHIALREILVEQSQWSQTFDAMSKSSLGNKQSLLVSFGSEKCVPPTAVPRVGGQVLYMTNYHEVVPRLSALKMPIGVGYSENDIAVVGMAVNVAGAEDVDEFWHLNKKGESQHREVPAERFTFDTHYRTVDPQRKWFGNFIKDHDAFDHKFFHKSPREAATQDPQQRLFLQSAYQAVEQSGYFNTPNVDTNVGVYVGVCAADYEANIACYAPNAFSATGNLKSFIAGKISHYFGWHGPGLTIDTACSASAVAIHQACRAILGGDCTAAIAGGTNVMTSPLWFQNLAGATFLSPTGACKPFDAKADGYCRGEAVSCVFLKKMSKAVEDGDLIIGTIKATAVYQNDNCTPIFVPNSPSLSSLFRDVVRKAGLSPKDITLVEAHGTGTPVGDPAEYESILSILGGTSVRSKPLPLSSVKGLIGHTECVSGVIALIKVLLAIHHGEITPQASFQTPSPKLKASKDDMIQIPTQLMQWDAEYRAALINNYGASGSNASMIVTQPPKGLGNTLPSSGKYPFWFTGFDERSVKDYASRLRTFLASNKSSLSLANLAFNVYRQSNRTLPQGLIFSSGSVDELDTQLAGFVKGDGKLTITTKKDQRPVILCFGGQISRFVGLDKTVFESNSKLRAHLDRCNSTLLSLGLDSIYPAIFEKNIIENPVHLQTTLFAMQYSCAQTWIDCGVKPAAVVGHSFGELVAQCIAGVLSLRDSLRVVAGRAQLINESWGSDSGAMMAVEGKLEDVQALLQKASQSGESATIACYNGPTTFTLAGPTKAIDAVADVLPSVSGVRGKKLSVSNAFHSTLVEPLKADLAKIAQGMNFKEPTIRWERATEQQTSPNVGPEFFATHMRDPVFANHAFQRLHQDFSSAIWLEAGSNSTITKMANKALGSPATSYFAEVSITSDSGSSNLADTFVGLWKEGLNIPHWSHHKSQAQAYSAILLPPYQFEKSRHWMTLKKPAEALLASVQQQIAAPVPVQQALPTELYTFVGFQDDAKRAARFRVNTMIKKYEELVSGHMIVQTAPICPATLEVDIMIEALLGLRPELVAAGLQPEIQNVENLAPICIDPSRAVWLDLVATAADFQSWNWEMISTNAQGAGKTTHVKGQVIFRSIKDAKAEFARYERLIPHQRAVDIINDPYPEDVLQGRNVYKVFGEIVDYSEPYQGLKKLVGKGNTSAGRVVKKHAGETYLDTHLSDAFSQVGGFWVNCMTDRAPTDMYIAAGFEAWIRRPGAGKPSKDAERPDVWNIIACHTKASEKAYTTDIFIFEAGNGQLYEVILGINYAKIPKSIMSKTLVKLTAPGGIKAAPASAAAAYVAPAATAIPEVQISAPSPALQLPTDIPARSEKPKKTKTPKDDKSQVVITAIIDILAELSGIDADKIKVSTDLADIGIDSLVGMEMCHDLEAKFECSLDMDRMAEVLSVNDVVQCVLATLGIEAGAGGPESDGEEDDYVHLSASASTSGTVTPRSGIESASSVSEDEGDDEKEAGDLKLSASDVLGAFGESKKLTDKFITDFKCSGYMDEINPKQTQLCVALVVEGYEKLGCHIKTAKAGEKLTRITFAPQHGRLVKYLDELLEKEARLVDIDAEGNMIRTAVSVPLAHKTSKEIVDSLVAAYPDHSFANRLAYFCGTKLVEVLKGELDGVKLIFGNEEGRHLVSGLYGDSLLNKLFYTQMEDILTRLAARLPRNSGPLKILEMGAGTGGTTKYLVPLLAKLGHPVEYTFTDLAPSFVAAARRNWKAYPFMKFRAHDIEKEPAEDLIGTQHLVVASNAVHATHSLTVSVANIRKALRPDGFLMMLEMTETLPWVDIIFGLLEGWWLFEDGREHAISHQSRWERELHAQGYGHVDWTDGHLAENNLQRIIIAMASGPKLDRLPIPPKLTPLPDFDLVNREAVVASYTQKFTSNFSFSPAPSSQSTQPASHSVVVTGATGSLGAHLVAALAALPQVSTVWCINRLSRGLSEPEKRQLKSFTEKSISLPSEQFSKLRILETDSSKPLLGLGSDLYSELSSSVTGIIHNAWPMSGVRPIKMFESQFQVLRNLIDLAASASTAQGGKSLITFQFISSIAVVGHYPLITGQPNVPEQRVAIDSVLPNGYGDAKYVCERMLDETLHKFPQSFRTMSVRLGQVAGSTKTGYWNSVEHLSFLIKSSQTLKAFPAFEGELSWTPVDVVASTLGDLVLSDAKPYPMYHIDNPVRQDWTKMVPVLARALGIDPEQEGGVIDFKEWVKRVRRFPGSVEKDNPAYKLIDFLDDNFLRMSCGGLLLDTKLTREHSPSLAAMGEVSAEVAEGYIKYWKGIKFLAA
ncbi:hypothetical protein QBC44DRAFT_320652 [Cladorrhinum sp. PSN332]|nr:hypothetical protein QBC44DRAFT_320652 [Cladorrhinum sp. PSN332]